MRLKRELVGTGVSKLVGTGVSKLVRSVDQRRCYGRKKHYSTIYDRNRTAQPRAREDTVLRQKEGLLNFFQILTRGGQRPTVGEGIATRIRQDACNINALFNQRSSIKIMPFTTFVSKTENWSAFSGLKKSATEKKKTYSMSRKNLLGVVNDPL